MKLIGFYVESADFAELSVELPLAPELSDEPVAAAAEPSLLASFLYLSER